MTHDRDTTGSRRGSRRIAKNRQRRDLTLQNKRINYEQSKHQREQEINAFFIFCECDFELTNSITRDSRIANYKSSFKSKS